MHGDYIPLNENDGNIVAYLRRYKDKTVLVALNMSQNKQTASFDLAAQGFSIAKPKILLTTNASRGADLSHVSLEPFEVYIAEISAGRRPY